MVETRLGVSASTFVLRVGDVRYEAGKECTGGDNCKLTQPFRADFVVSSFHFEQMVRDLVCQESRTSVYRLNPLLERA